MREQYIINLESVKGYLTDLKTEHNFFTSISRKIFSNGYLYNCSDSSIVSMRNKIDILYSNIDNGYKNIDLWLNGYIYDNNNLELSLKNGIVSGLNDHETSIVLNSFVDKNNVNIDESPDVISQIEMAEDYNVNEEESILKFTSLRSAFESGYFDAIVEDIYGSYASEFLEKSSTLADYEDYQKTLDSDVKRLENELNQYIKYSSANSSNMTTAGGGVSGILNGKEEELRNGYKEIQEFNEIIKTRKLTPEELDNLTIIQKKYYLYLTKQSDLMDINKKIVDLRNDLNLLPYRVEADKEEYKEFQNTYSIEDSYNQIMEANTIYRNHENEYDWFALYEYFAVKDVDINEIGVYGETIKLGEKEAKVNADIFYKYASAEEKQMYHYLFNTKGAEEANKYITKLLNRINETAGKDLAKEIDYYYSGYADEDFGYKVLSGVAALTTVTKNGIKTGFDQFNRGLNSCVVHNKIMTVDEWREYYESDYVREIGLGYYYDVLSNTAKMLPGMAVGLATSPVLGSALYTASIWGSTHDEALRSGMSDSDAFLYSTLIASEEFLTDLLFKATPGLSKVDFEQSLFKRLFKEMSGEALQSYYEGWMDCIYKGKEWNLGEITEEAFYSSMVAAGSFFLTSGSISLKNANDIIIKYKLNGQEYEIKGTKGIQKVLKEAGIVDSSFDFDNISDFDMDLTAADMIASGGNITEIKITDIKEVTEEKLSKIEYKDRILFTMPDERMLSFDELQSELGYDGDLSTKEEINAPDSSLNDKIIVNENSATDSITDFEKVMSPIAELPQNQNNAVSQPPAKVMQNPSFKLSPEDLIKLKEIETGLKDKLLFKGVDENVDNNTQSNGVNTGVNIGDSIITKDHMYKKLKRINIELAKTGVYDKMTTSEFQLIDELTKEVYSNQNVNYNETSAKLDAIERILLMKYGPDNTIIRSIPELSDFVKELDSIETNGSEESIKYYSDLYERYIEKLSTVKNFDFLKNEYKGDTSKEGVSITLDSLKSLLTEPEYRKYLSNDMVREVLLDHLRISEDAKSYGSDFIMEDAKFNKKYNEIVSNIWKDTITTSINEDGTFNFLYSNILGAGVEEQGRALLGRKDQQSASYITKDFQGIYHDNFKKVGFIYSGDCDFIAFSARDLNSNVLGTGMVNKEFGTTLATPKVLEEAGIERARNNNESANDNHCYNEVLIKGDPDGMAIIGVGEGDLNIYYDETQRFAKSLNLPVREVDITEDAALEFTEKNKEYLAYHTILSSMDMDGSKLTRILNTDEDFLSREVYSRIRKYKDDIYQLYKSLKENGTYSKEKMLEGYAEICKEN